MGWKECGRGRHSCTAHLCTSNLDAILGISARFSHVNADMYILWT